MAIKRSKESYEQMRETIRLEREEIRRKIAEILEANYERLEREAEKVAPDFDYEKETEALKAEEEAEMAAFEWADGTAEEAAETEAAEADEDTETEAEAGKEAEAEAGTETPEEKMPEETAEEKPEEKPLPAAVVSASRYPKEKKDYKSRAAKALLGDKHKKMFTAAVLMMALFAGYQAWDYLVPKTVNIEYTTYDGTVSAEYATTARTADEVRDELIEEGVTDAADIDVNEEDLMKTPGEMVIANGTDIEILEATKTEAKIAGKARDLWLVPGTVEENLSLNDVSYDDDDEVKPGLSESVDEDTKITVNEIHYDIKEKTEKVEAVDKVILDPSLTSGVQETEEGNDGEGVFTYTTKYVNGKNKGTEREVKEWITEPHDNVLRLGTSATGNEGEYVVAKTFTANTTAYTAGSGARGALGQSVHVGTCAVDPRYVSLRSEMWIEGYGYAYANDTGGAVKGNVVDLYMSSRSQCIRWGRRNKTAYVLVPEGD